MENQQQQSNEIRDGRYKRRTGGTNGGVGPAHDGKGRVSVYAQVKDLQATLDRAEKLGGKTILPPSWLFMAYLASRRAVIGVYRAFTGSC